jgi:tRNA/tmRNA/rRNA uracil-C5-methylase (TrmA/RlmC/RlmD family)
MAGTSRAAAVAAGMSVLRARGPMPSSSCAAVRLHQRRIKREERGGGRTKLTAEIGTALLQRCEALELKHTRAEHQVEIKRKALADSLRHVANLERANTTHLAKYAELSHAGEALEKVGVRA